MTEDFLYYIWQFKLWKGELQTLSREKISVEKPGLKNPDAGPDFLNAQIRINDVLWAGNVEIHVKTSDWYFHKHEDDENYKKLILHVVYFHDLETLPHDCPLLVLHDLVPQELISNFAHLQQPFQFIPCENLFAEADAFTVNGFVESLFVERLEQRVSFLKRRLELLHGDWEALLFERISFVFGLKVNGEAFELLAKSFPFKILLQIIRKNENTEAFLFGQAGFLQDLKDAYQFELHQEYEFLRHKHNTSPIDNHLFKFLRLRPPNFPTVRIAQLAALYNQESQLFASFMRIRSMREFEEIFKQIRTDPYWDTHYNFGTESKKEPKTISVDRIHLIFLNAVMPVRYLFDQENGNADSETLFDMVRQIKPEQNSVIESYRRTGAEIGNALESQAYLELKKNFCDQKKCLHCRIGNKIMQHA